MSRSHDDLKKIEGMMSQVAEEVVNKKIEDLGAAVARGFDEQREYMDKRFEQSEIILRHHSEILNQHTGLLMEHTTQHRKMREVLANHTERLKHIETKQEAVQTTLRDHGRRITELEPAR